MPDHVVPVRVAMSAVVDEVAEEVVLTRECAFAGSVPCCHSHLIEEVGVVGALGVLVAAEEDVRWLGWCHWPNHCLDLCLLSLQPAQVAMLPADSGISAYLIHATLQIVEDRRVSLVGEDF